MVNNKTDTGECLVYPGVYRLLPETEALVKELSVTGNDQGVQVLVNMEELENCFEIEMIVPGVKREELIIYITDNIVSVIALQHPCKPKKDLQIHEFDACCIQRHILLPVNADTEFISAEFKRGLLTMHIPKSEHPYNSGITSQIVIY